MAKDYIIKEVVDIVFRCDHCGAIIESKKKSFTCDFCTIMLCKACKRYFHVEVGGNSHVGTLINTTKTLCPNCLDEKLEKALALLDLALIEKENLHDHSKQLDELST